MWKTVIIDDDPVVLTGMRNAIPWEELQLTWVGESMDGHGGLKLIRETGPDIVITDVSMPVLNGLEMLERLRDEGFEGKCVILSGYSDFEYARQALRLQVTDYLSKPITVKTLTAVLASVVAGLESERRQQDELSGLKKKLDAVEPLVVYEWLQAVLNGNRSSDGWQKIEEIERIRSKWASEAHMVVGIGLRDNENARKWIYPDLGLLRFAVGNVVKETLALYWPNFDFVELEGVRFVVLLHASSDKTEEEWLHGGSAIASRLEDALGKALKLEAVAACGPKAAGEANVAASSQEAFRIVNKLLGPEELPFKEPNIDNLKHKRTIDFTVQYIHEHYADDLTLTDLAVYAGISANYLGQLFRQSMGLTFIQYLTCVRMEKAKQLLLEGKYYVYEIAEKVGYQNITYFTTQFKKYFGGQSPSSFLKS